MVQCPQVELVPGSRPIALVSTWIARVPFVRFVQEVSPFSDLAPHPRGVFTNSTITAWKFEGIPIGSNAV